MQQIISQTIMLPDYYVGIIMFESHVKLLYFISDRNDTTVLNCNL